MITCQCVNKSIKVACVDLVSKLSRENVTVENDGLRGSSTAGLQGKAKRDNSQARTKRSYNILFKWKGRFVVLPTGFGKVLFTEACLCL